jgi:hypothetical protein
VPVRLRDLDAGAIVPADPTSPSDGPPAAAAGAVVPTGASSDTVDAPLRSSVVSLTNGPSMIFGRLGDPARPVDPVQRPPEGPELIRAALIAAEYPRFPQRCGSSVRRYVSASLGDKPGSARAAVSLAWVPRSRALARLAALLFKEENGTSCAKDLGYGNSTVPWEFAGERPVCRRVPKPERGTRCTTKPNTMRTQGIPSQPSVSRGRRGNGPKRPASRIRHPTYSVPGKVTWPGAAALRPVGRIGRSFPASAARRRLRAQDTRTMPLDV